MKTDLSSYNNSWYNPGSFFKKGLWFIFNSMFFLNPFFPFSFLKCWLLRMFGANIGNGVIIKPRVNIKYPWLLSIGDYSWVGEKVWIDNLDKVSIGKNCCLSQGALLLCGNHDYTKKTFNLIIKPIKIEDGVWIGAKAVVTSGITCYEHSVLSVNSVANIDLESYTIYQGNPAVAIRKRIIAG